MRAIGEPPVMLPHLGDPVICCVSGGGEAQPTARFWRGRHPGGPYGGRSRDHVWNQWLLDEATKMPLVVVAAISAQPYSALLQQIEFQWNPFDLNRSQQPANRCERFTSTDRHKNGVTFNGVQVGLGCFSDRPGQVSLVHNSFHDHHPLVLRFGLKVGS
jgi:hypothetical protein